MFLFPAKTFLRGQLIQEYSKIYHDCLCNAQQIAVCSIKNKYILVP